MARYSEAIMDRYIETIERDIDRNRMDRYIEAIENDIDRNMNYKAIEHYVHKAKEMRQETIRKTLCSRGEWIVIWGGVVLTLIAVVILGAYYGWEMPK